ncbi:hypothetical protein Lpp77_02587, partial [Lacticaseibacillus paracasei subsp. paracasei CNCM I-4270]
QCAYLIKQYGYNAVDKEDEQKYQQRNPNQSATKRAAQKATEMAQSL